VQQYVGENKQLPLGTNKGEMYQGINIGRWVCAQRKSTYKHQLTQEQQQQLEDLPGWTWEVEVRRGLGL
jgi:hypothetical protein